MRSFHVRFLLITMPRYENELTSSKGSLSVEIAMVSILFRRAVLPIKINLVFLVFNVS